MIYRRCYALLVMVCAGIVFASVPYARGQSQGAPTKKDVVLEKTSRVQPADVAGNWQVSWQGRLGTEQCLVQLQQDGRKLSGTFRDLHGVMPLSGTIDEKKLSFEVQFSGARPFSTQFTGSADGDKIEGTSQAVGVDGGGAFLGHAGEVVHPEHPWTAKRIADQPTHQPASAGDNSNR